MRKLFVLLGLGLLMSCDNSTRCAYTLSVEYYNKGNDTIHVEAFSDRQNLRLVDSTLILGKYYKFRSNVKGYSIINKECDSIK